MTGQNTQGTAGCNRWITWCGWVVYTAVFLWLISLNQRASPPVYRYVLEWGRPTFGAIEGPFDHNVSYTDAPSIEDIRFPATEATTTEKEVVGWGKNIPRDAVVYIEPFQDTARIPGLEICSDEKIKLVIIVATQPGNFWHRTLIRETWGSEIVSHVKVGFFIGKSPEQSTQMAIEEENAHFQDIIQADIVDSYNNLTLKSIAILKWFVRDCQSSWFLMKCDADTFVDVKLLVQYLSKYKRYDTLTGWVCERCWAFRDVVSQWYVPKYLYARNIYPHFLVGNSYIMSMDVAARLYSAALRTPLIHLEDVFITGICSQVAGITPTQFPGASPYAWNITRVCKYKHSMCHPVRPDRMVKLWESRKLVRKNDIFHETKWAARRRRRLNKILQHLGFPMSVETTRQTPTKLWTEINGTIASTPNVEDIKPQMTEKTVCSTQKNTIKVNATPSNKEMTLNLVVNTTRES